MLFRARTWLALGALAAGLAFCSREAHADSCTERQSDGFASPGVLLSVALGRHSSFGLGAEMSYNYYRNLLSSVGVGAFANGVYYFGGARYARFAAGAQANALWFLGVEAGWAATTAIHGPPDTGPATGPYLGGTASVVASDGLGTIRPPAIIPSIMLALRGTIPSFGDKTAGTISLDLGIKDVIQVSGRRPICIPD